MTDVVGDTTWIALQTLFARATSLPASERGRVLSEAAARGAHCRRSLERLLTAHESRHAALDHPIDIEVADAPAADALIGRRIGSYLITDAIGQGALGAVYRAIQEHPRRWVALKLPRFRRESPELLARLEFEAETLGRLQHPAIAQIIEAGVFDRGDGPQPFFVMELIEGPTLTAYANQHDLSRAARIRLMIRVCEGVQHAHQRGVIHLDLKPSNTLVSDETATRAKNTALARPSEKTVADAPRSSPLPKILDFGIARWLDHGPGGPTTGSGGVFGTLAYMSPEQLDGDLDATSTRSDIYALGVIAFELLCGRLPLEIPAGLPPHQAIEEARRCRRLSPREAAPRLPLDLCAILSKAMNTDPTHRYASSAELAADFERYLRSEAVLARRPTPLYLLSRFAKRHRGWVGGAALAFVALLVGLAGFAWKANQEQRQRLAADARLQTAMNSNLQIVETVENGLADLPGSTPWRSLLAEAGLERLLALRAEVSVEHPISDDLDYGLAYAHQRLGEVRIALGDPASALAAFGEALEIRRRQAGCHSSQLRFQRALGVGEWKVADALVELDRLDEADDYLQRSLAIHEKLRNTPGDAPVYDAVYVGLAQQRLGIVAEQHGDHNAARERFEAALREFSAGLQKEPNNIQLLRGQVRSLRGLGTALAAGGDPVSAETSLLSALRVCEQLSAICGKAGVRQRQQRAETLAALAKILDATECKAESQAAGCEARQIFSDLAESDPLRADFARRLSSLSAEWNDKP
ncbi:MAG: serine/threonine protein kinase [Phycisphaerales bacterium]|nr:serine/threonine protein kinase [Phycisphaerales bacterium]